MKILHIAPFNFSGVPIEFVRAERALGHTSRLITLGRDRRGYQEDVCLELPFLRSPFVWSAKRLVSRRVEQTNIILTPSERPPVWRPRGWPERILINLRDGLWRRSLQEFVREFPFFDFDVYQLDGGHGLLRSGEFIREVKRRGKKVVCCYLGSDLRLRGVIEEIDRLSDLNVTVEFDHLKLHPHIHHIFFPFDVRKFKTRQKENEVLRIGHAPTSRKAKGTKTIISAIRQLQSTHRVDFALIQNLPHAKAIELKYTCDILVDQLGQLGYGMNSLEALAMGIPTCTSLPEEYESYLGSHPFVNVDEYNLGEKLTDLIENRELRHQKGAEGRAWVEKFHDSRQVVTRIHTLLSAPSPPYSAGSR